MVRVVGHGRRVLGLWQLIGSVYPSTGASVEAQGYKRRIWRAVAALLRPFVPESWSSRGGRGAGGGGAGRGAGRAGVEGTRGRVVTEEEEQEQEEKEEEGLLDVLAGFKKMQAVCVEDECWLLCFMCMCLGGGGDGEGGGKGGGGGGGGGGGVRSPRTFVPQAVDLCVQASIEGLLAEETVLRRVSRQVCVWLYLKGDQVSVLVYYLTLTMASK
jgi:hypothetical protein